MNETQENNENLSKIYKNRRRKLALQMKNQGVAAILFEDKDGCRDPAVRYYTGHPNDALFILFSDETSFLVAWDENLAKKMANVGKIIPYSRYENSHIRAVKAIANYAKIEGKQTFELPEVTSYPDFLQYVDALSGWDVRCRKQSLHNFAEMQRAVKDEIEIASIRQAAKVTDRIIDLIEEKVRSGEIKTETDVALLIEKELRKDGCEKTGFDTLAAGPGRSFAIHCFPNYTNQSWPAEGLSILDFGVVCNGYTSDVTLTIAKGKLTEAQEKQLELVQKAYTECLKLYEKNVPLAEAARKAAEIFAAEKRSMPHSLGHGIGLEIHEAPFVRAAASSENLFLPGMVVTLEPGLYDAETGGTRLENDVLITEKGPEVLTHSRIIRID